MENSCRLKSCQIAHLSGPLRVTVVFISRLKDSLQKADRVTIFVLQTEYSKLSVTLDEAGFQT